MKIVIFFFTIEIKTHKLLHLVQCQKTLFNLLYMYIYNFNNLLIVSDKSDL